MLWFLDHPSLRRGLLHALVSALLISVRIPGVIIPALTLLGLGYQVVGKLTSWKRALANYGDLLYSSHWRLHRILAGTLEGPIARIH